MRHSAILVFANKQDLVSVHNAFRHAVTASCPKPSNVSIVVGES